jgi:hypothetical protein
MPQSRVEAAERNIPRAVYVSCSSVGMLTTIQTQVRMIRKTAWGGTFTKDTQIGDVAS